MSSVSVIERAAHTRVLEESDVTSFLTATEDFDSSLIAEAITAIGSAFGEYLGFPLWRERVAEAVGADSFGYRRLHTLRRPIEAVHAIEVGQDSGVFMDVADFSVRGSNRDHLLHLNGWWVTLSSSEYVVDYTAGWYMPGQVSQWTANETYATGALVHPTASERIFQANNDGDSGGSEPTWPLDHDTTVVDNEVTWQQLAAARLLPSEVKNAASVAVAEYLRGARSVSGLAQSGDGATLEVRSSFRGSLPWYARNVLDRYRI